MGRPAVSDLYLSAILAFSFPRSQKGDLGHPAKRQIDASREAGHFGCGQMTTMPKEKAWAHDDGPVKTWAEK
jgi:hypothetical protein